MRSNQSSRTNNTYLNLAKNLATDLSTTPEKNINTFNNLSLEYKLN